MEERIKAILSDIGRGVYEKDDELLPNAWLRHCKALCTTPPIKSGSQIDYPSEMESLATKIDVLEYQLAHEQRRQCFLIGFSVLINPIDVGANPNALLNFFGHSNTGNTDAVRMMEKTFSLLDSNRRYMNADVIWITDYRIPLPPVSLLHKHQSCRTAGTCFYGLQIGISALVKDWHPYFDEIEQISYTPSRMY